MNKSKIISVDFDYDGQVFVQLENGNSPYLTMFAHTHEMQEEFVAFLVGKFYFENEAGHGYICD